MNNIKLLEDYIEALRKPKPFKHTNEQKAQAIENLIQENKELKEKFYVIQRKIYRLQEDNIELLKPRGKDQLNYKYIECPKVEAEWYKSESYIKDNYIPKSKVKEIIYPTPENPISFEVQTSEMYKKLEKLVEGE